MRRDGYSKAILDLGSTGGGASSRRSNVSDALVKIEGVIAVDVNHVTNKVSVTYDRDKVSVERIKEMIKKVDGDDAQAQN